MDEIEKIPVKYISATKLATFLTCPLKFKFKYLMKIEPEFSSPAFLYGSSIHRALEFFHKNIGKIKIEPEELFTIFQEELEDQIESHKDNNISWGRNSQESFLETGLISLGKYYELHKKDAPPLTLVNQEGQILPGVELKFTVPLLNPQTNTFYEDYKIEGIIDLIQLEKDILSIIDHKTSARKYESFDVNTSLQLVIYSYAFRNLLKSGYKIPISKEQEDRVIFNVLMKDTKAPIITYDRVINQEDINSMLRIISMMIFSIEMGIFTPIYNKMICAWCDVKNFCEKYKP